MDTATEKFAKCVEVVKRFEDAASQIAVAALLEIIDEHYPSTEFLVFTTSSDEDEGNIVELVDGGFVMDGEEVDRWDELPRSPEVDVRLWHAIAQRLPFQPMWDASIAEQRENKYYNMENYVSVSELRKIASRASELRKIANREGDN
ncbi:hypothetical protein SEA_SPEEDDEMON_1440 [Gordonia phage SpeedDemon]|nr:hypothetical protein SEA_SPEEDDEMON_1440 [Gordonia phage SpeedDemon]